MVSNEACGRSLKDDFQAKQPLVMWNQHADDQPAIEPLEFTRERKAWASIAFVSEWQRDQFCNIYWVDAHKTRVMRNAISPAFAASPRRPVHGSRRAGAPVLVYTSAPYRGLNVLLDAVPIIRSAISDMRLRVFSGIETLQVDDSRTILMRSSTADAQSTDGVDYIGPVPQAELAAELSRAAALGLSLDVSGNIVHRSHGSDVGRRHDPDDPFGSHARDDGRVRADDRAARG